MAADSVEPRPSPGSASLLDESGYTHERAFYLAQLALAAGRHADACAFVTALVKNKSAAKLLLSESERQLFSQAFKQQLAGHRGTLKLLELVAEHEQYPLHLTVLDVYARQMESGVLDLAKTVLSLIIEEQVPVCEDALQGGPPPALPQLGSPAGSSSVPSEPPTAAEGAAAPAECTAASAEAAESAPTVGGAAAASESSANPAGSKSASAVAPPPAAPSTSAVAQALVFWFKLAADYCRYVSESARDAAVVARHSDLALSYYSKARSHGALRLHPASPAVLGVALNFTVFLYEIRHCEEEARELAEAALVAAEEALAADSAATATAAASSEAALAAGPAASEAAPAGVTTGAVAGETKAVPPAPYAALTPSERAESGAVRALIAENLRLWREEEEDAAAAAAAGASEAGRPGVHEGASPAAGHASGASAMPQGSVGAGRR